MKKLMLVPLLAVALAACSDDDDDTSASTSTPNTAAIEAAVAALRPENRDQVDAPGVSGLPETLRPPVAR